METVRTNFKAESQKQNCTVWSEPITRKIKGNIAKIMIFSYYSVQTSDGNRLGKNTSRRREAETMKTLRAKTLKLLSLFYLCMTLI